MPKHTGRPARGGGIVRHTTVRRACLLCVRVCRVCVFLCVCTKNFMLCLCMYLYVCMFVCVCHCVSFSVYYSDSLIGEDIFFAYVRASVSMYIMPSVVIYLCFTWYTPVSLAIVFYIAPMSIPWNSFNSSDLFLFFATSPPCRRLWRRVLQQGVPGGGVEAPPLPLL